MKDLPQTPYPDTGLLLDGEWKAATDAASVPVINPATGEAIGHVAKASAADLENAVVSAEKAFGAWKQSTPLTRSAVLRGAAALLRDRVDEIAPIMTLEQGKPVAEACAEIMACAEIFEWFAEEARRSYGRIVPSRLDGSLHMVLKEPVGVVAAFTPWNFPMSQAARKLGAALAAGCAVVIKPPEETPASPAALIQTLIDAGLPAGVVNVVYGVPSEVSEALIPHPKVRKISFTGSTAVGKLLASMAGAHMKRITMELGGHAPALVFDDADLERAADVLITAKFRNAGQVCIAPTRFLVQRGVYDRFVDLLKERIEALHMGPGIAPETSIGALANPRRVEAMKTLVADAIEQGARCLCGGNAGEGKGWFYAPTLLVDVPQMARAMNEEPFGPVVLVAPFDTTEEAITEANRLDYGLAAFGFTASLERAEAIRTRVQAGMVSINHWGIAFAELPFGGVKDSGYGSEGGLEAIESYLNTKLVSQMA
ncbi:NAD-dependent succinate-semialdehyde dehydrogenase [Roseovarius sp. CH_XMU1461]|uniref:NAD-dependent succinate-semialdehyde dehydrogenase n=1 Tax=Roseovarius sp. CH_XMU1461 TaxID=3107777 RepID=UPI00300A7678